MFGFEYESIEDRADGDHIRILTLAPSKGFTDPIHVRMNTVNLNSDLSFEALSYCWGDASDKLLIFCNDKPFPVTENLESALRHLRSQQDERVIWIDAICINQNDDSERAYQVNLMRDIYRKATKVVAWLGQEYENSDLVFPVCERMIKFRADVLTEDGNEDMQDNNFLWGPDKNLKMKQRVQEIRRKRAAKAQAEPEATKSNGQEDDHAESDADDFTEDVDLNNDEIAAFLRLLNRPYWRRCWVIQEVVLSRKVELLCGTKSIDWEHFYVGFTLGLLYGGSGLEGRPEQITRTGLILMTLLRQQFYGEDAGSKPVSFHGLLNSVMPLQASDPRDKIYSILGLVADDECRLLGIEVDYTISVEECYKRASVAIMSMTGNLDVLGNDQATHSMFHLPSWCPDWSYLPRPAPVSISRTDKADVLMDFSASKVNKWPSQVRDNGNTLIVSGYTFDRIVLLGDILTVPDIDFTDLNDGTSSVKGFAVLWKKIIPGLGSYFDVLIQWDKLAMSPKYSKYPNGEGQELIFAQTMCVGDIPGGAEVGLQRYKKWKNILRGPRKFDFMKSIGAGGGVYKSLLGITGIFSTRKNIGDRVFSTATEKTLYRRLARTEKGYLALVPSLTAVGDQITLFRSGKTPFVARPKSNDGQMELMGPCYMHGIMFGEAWDEKLCSDIELV